MAEKILLEPLRSLIEEAHGDIHKNHFTQPSPVLATPSQMSFSDYVIHSLLGGILGISDLRVLQSRGKIDQGFLAYVCSGKDNALPPSPLRDTAIKLLMSHTSREAKLFRGNSAFSWSAHEIGLQQKLAQGKLFPLEDVPYLLPTKHTGGDISTAGDTWFAMIFAYPLGIDLYDFFRLSQFDSQDEKLEVVCSTLGGAAGKLAKIHTKGIHGDVKPENFVVMPEGGVFAIDIGTYVELGSFSSPLATAKYMTPEMLMKTECVYGDPSRDMFAFGTMLYEKLFGTAPFVRTHYDALKKLPASNAVISRPHCLSKRVYASMLENKEPVLPASPELVDATLACLALNPCDRPRADEMQAVLQREVGRFDLSGFLLGHLLDYGEVLYRST